MFVELDKNYSKGSEALKTLVEQIYYIDRSIIKCDFKGKGVSLVFETDSIVDEKILNDEIVKMSVSILKSFDRVETKIVHENEGVGTYDLDPIKNLN